MWSSFLLLVLAIPTLLEARAPWPDTPFQVSGRDILGASGEKIKLAGVNWPGAADTKLPEGLQYASADSIASMIKSLGMNIVRLTFAIEMVDDYYASSPNQSLEATLVNALGQSNGAKVLNQILAKNPAFTPNTTRLDVFDAVAAALAKQQIWVHLDNHVSQAKWCCGSDDGNAWFGDTYFNVANWQRGLVFMANRARSWTGFTSVGLRNELRQPVSGSPAQPYTWNVWMENMIPAADAIHANNTAPLIYFSGFGYDTDMTYPIQRQTWNGVTFTPESYSFKNKIVYEIHNYDNGATNCDSIRAYLYTDAYCAMNVNDNSCPNHGPVIISEFGYNQEDRSSDSVYAQCIKGIVLGQPSYPGGWMQWTLSGSYYIRSGTQDSEDFWGLTNRDWSGWRNQTVIDNYVLPFVRSTLQPGS